MADMQVLEPETRERRGETRTGRRNDIPLTPMGWGLRALVRSAWAWSEPWTESDAEHHDVPNEEEPLLGV